MCVYVCDTYDKVSMNIIKTIDLLYLISVFPHCEKALTRCKKRKEVSDHLVEFYQLENAVKTI